MIARAITAIIGVVIGLFATFAVFSAILGGLDSFYLLTQDACNYGSLNSPKRLLRVAPENPEHPGDADEIDWSRDGLDVTHDGSGGCEVGGGVDDTLTYLSPTGDEVVLGGLALQAYDLENIEHGIQEDTGMASQTDTVVGELFGLWNDGSDAYQFFRNSQGTVTVNVWNVHSGLSSGDKLRSFTFQSADEPTGGVAGDDDYFWIAYGDQGELRSWRRDGSAAGPSISLAAANDDIADLANKGHFIYALERATSVIYAYNTRTRSYSGSDNLQGNTGFDWGGLWITDEGHLHLWYSPGGIALLRLRDDYQDPGSYPVSIEYRGSADLIGDFLSMSDRHGHTVEPLGATVFYGLYTNQLGASGVTPAYASHSLGEIPYTESGSLDWIQAEDVFTAQERLVTLLAVIAAIGMPIGAMTAIVFFGQAVISSGISGSGASQVMVAIAAVVVILVSIQMFQQFAGFMGTAFDAVNGDRFVVFDETLGSLAETIAEFWGVLAFAGFINIASIVWRNYSGNFSIGGNAGGL